MASQVCWPDRIVFLTTHEIHFHQYFDSLGTNDTELCTILLYVIYKRAVSTSYMTTSKDAFTPDRIHLEQVRNWYRLALRLYGTWQIRSRSVSYPVPNGFTNDDTCTVWNCTKWNRSARNSCKRSLKVTSNTGIVDYIQARLERVG